MNTFEIIIIGAGPAGLQLSYFLKQANISHIVLERADCAGSFFTTYPPHKKLISINKVNTGFDDDDKNLRWDWNSLLSKGHNLLLKQFDQSYYPNSDNLVAYLNQFAQQHQLPVLYQCAVSMVERHQEQFLVTTAQQEQYCARLVVDATGTGKANVPDIEGIEHAHAYAEMSNDVSAFKNKRVLILGKGNSAFETADSLLQSAANIHLISPNDFNFAWVTHYPGHLRSVNQGFLDTFFLKQQNAILNGKVKWIRVNDKGTLDVEMMFSEDNDIEVNQYDAVVNCTGFSCELSYYDKAITPNRCLHGKFPELTENWESTNVPGLYFAGTNMQYNDYKKSSTPFIHGIRHNVEALSQILISKLRNTPLPSSKISAQQLYSSVCERIRKSASVWFLFGNMYDVYQNTDDGAYQCFKDIPRLVFERGEQFNQFSGYILMFSYAIPQDENERKKFSQHGFLHPVVRQYAQGEIVAERHMLEDIYSEWENLERLDNGIRAMLS
ncbi:MAG: NAD(P)-binding domain-containing protein [Gammaproteobacteria bacterium]|nr:NAD(P)-binding domain-containing protein [Gammaproteobacteria bacterium]MBU2057235.1 NAD(P)-binding domain-containing protein [Gammaproteobacteria bacterium]MBU2174837.1 NAD(P)-binding domain-containing protein [Gammaproteobacteria bacterium]MBU2245442.1 NAD(P)-binding domain-containing protein [Gammaproteobacteria bacterium]MBU2344223.1 NAD(P)-binding domain-containing protein [Gammaproteobacteria bacterium]